MEITWKVVNRGVGEGDSGEKVQWIRSINGRYKIDGGDGVNNSIGNVEAKELICTTHGHELRWENAGGRCRGN